MILPWVLAIVDEERILIFRVFRRWRKKREKRNQMPVKERHAVWGARPRRRKKKKIDEKEIKSLGLLLLGKGEKLYRKNKCIL